MLIAVLRLVTYKCTLRNYWNYNFPLFRRHFELLMNKPTFFFWDFLDECEGIVFYAFC